MALQLGRAMFIVCSQTSWHYWKLSKRAAGKLLRLFSADITESHLKGCCTPETFCQFTLQPIVLSFGHPAGDPDVKQCLANILYHLLPIVSLRDHVYHAPRACTETLKKLHFQLRVKILLEHNLRAPWPCRHLPTEQCTWHATFWAAAHSVDADCSAGYNVPLVPACACVLVCRACDRETNRPQLVADKQ